MKTIRSLAFNYLKYNSKKVRVIVLSIILTTILLFTVSLGTSTVRQYKIDTAKTEFGSYHVTFRDTNYDQYQDLKNNKAVKKVVPIQTIDKLSDDELGKYVNIKNIVDSEGKFDLRIQKMESDFEEVVTLVKGRYPQNNHEIIITRTLERNDLAITIGKKISDYTIVGIFQAKNAQAVYNYQLKEYGSFDTIFTPAAITKGNIDNGDNIDLVTTYKSSYNLYNKIYKDAQSLGGTYEIIYGSKRYNNADINFQLVVAYGQYEDFIFQRTMYIFMIIILIILSAFSAITIYNSFTISLQERKKQLGILRSLGASKRQLIKMLLYETLILSIISIPIGIIFSFSFGSIIIFIINKILENIIVNKIKLVVYPIFLIISVIFILLTIFLASFLPIIKMRKISAIEAIRESKDYKVLRSKEDYPIIKHLFGTTGEFAYKNMKRNKSKFTTVLVSLIASVVLFITISTFIDVIASSYVVDNGREADITIRISDNEAATELVQNIKSLVGKDRMTIIKERQFDFKIDNDNIIYDNVSNDGYYGIEIFGLDDASYNRYKKVAGLKNDNQILLYNYLENYDDNTDTNTYEVFFKDTIKDIEICRVDRKFYPDHQTIIPMGCYYHFNNFYITYDNELNWWSPAIIMRMEDYDNFINVAKEYETEQFIKDANSQKIDIYSEKFVKLDKQLNKLFAEYREKGMDIYYDNASLEEYEPYMIIKTIRLVLYIALIFVIIVCLINIINILNTSIALRETEFAVLKSVGMSNKKINSMLRLEQIFLGIKTLLWSLPLATGVVLMLMKLSKEITESGKVTISFPLRAYIISVVGVVSIIFIMIKYSISKIKKNNIIDSIRKQSI